MFEGLSVVFIVGCQRSGTTLTGQILGAHPDAVMIDEQDGLYALTDAIFARAGDLDAVWQRVLRKAREKYVDRDSRFTERDGELHLGERVTHLVFKSPNMTYFPAEIAASGLDARIVYPVRDPRGVVASMAKIDFINMVRQQQIWLERAPAMQARLGAVYAGLERTDMPEHVKRAIVWRSKTGLSDAFEAAGLDPYVFKYETLVEDKSAVCQAMCDHVGLPRDPAVEAHETCYVGFSPDGVSRRRRAVDRASLEAWREWLSLEAADAVIEAGGEVARTFGYVTGGTGRVRTIAAEVLDRPIVLLGRGGSGTRLISDLLGTAGLFRGNSINKSGDSVEWVDLIYATAVRRLRTRQEPPDVSQAFRQRAESILLDAERDGLWSPERMWGWKLPETMLVIEDAARAFPQARFIHLLRHPVTSSLRRTHMTSRMSNRIGETTMTAAYDALGYPADMINAHGEFMHNAVTWRFQVEAVSRFGREVLGPQRYVEVRYEDICNTPERAVAVLSEFLDLPADAFTPPEIDRTRTSKVDGTDPRIAEVWNLCGDLAETLGYGLTDDGEPVVTPV